MKILCKLAVVAALTCISQGCGPEPPRPGVLYVELVTPWVDDAAVRLRVTGDGILDPTAPRGYALYARATQAGLLEAAVLGQITSGDLLEFNVHDVHGHYTVTLDEVADTSNALRASLGGYAVQIREKH